MNLLRFKKQTRDLILPNGARVKVEVNDLGTIQQVHDPLDRTHGTARPEPIRMQLTNSSSSRKSSRRMGRQAFRELDMGLWAPLPDDVTGGLL